MGVSSEQGPEWAGGAAAGHAAHPDHAVRPGSSAQPDGAVQAGDAGAPGERKVFRLPGGLIAWWAWVIFAGANLVDLAITGRDHTAAEIAVSLAVVTGLVYACALRPRVIADSGGITVQNPFRDHRVPWGSVTSVDLAESVRVHCAQEPGAERPKIIHSWALYAQRRNRLRQELMGQGSSRRRPPRVYPPSSSYGQMPAEAQKMVDEPAAKLMAKQLDELAASARNHGAAAGPRVASWAWQPAVAIAVPVILAILVFTVFR